MSAALSLFDHLFALVLAVGFTAWAVWSFRRVRPALERDEPGARLREYRDTMIAEWGLTLVAVTAWIWAARPLGELGLGFPWDWGHAVGAGVAVLVAVGLGLQARMIAASPEARRSTGEQLGHLRAILPHTISELRAFLALSVTAGICEELLYRGWLIWYLDLLAGPVVAVVVSSVVFGLGHAGYGSASTAVNAGLLGLVLAGLYLLTGALWVPMVVHAAFDVAAGLTGWLAHRQPEAETVGAAGGSVEATG